MLSVTSLYICNPSVSRLLEPPDDPAADPGPEHVAGADLHRGHVPPLPHPQVSVRSGQPGHCWVLLTPDCQVTGYIHLPSCYTCANIELLRFRTKYSSPLCGLWVSYYINKIKS